MNRPLSQSRSELERRWLDLTRVILPGLAGAARWPIRLDHCFMRVCLDAAFGGPWHEHVRRPAIRSMSDTELSRAIGIAEGIVERPATLAELNQKSLMWRGKTNRPRQ